MCEIMVQNPIPILEKMSTRFLLGLPNEKKDNQSHVVWGDPTQTLDEGQHRERPERDRSSVWAIKEVGSALEVVRKALWTQKLRSK